MNSVEGLQLGNILLYQGEPIIITGILPSKLSHKDEPFRSMVHYEPVELTPDVLTKMCGFAHKSFDRFERGELVLVAVSGGIMVGRKKELCVLTVLKHLHELQNAYPFFTGQPLPITL